MATHSRTSRTEEPGGWSMGWVVVYGVVYRVGGLWGHKDSDTTERLTLFEDTSGF